MFNFQGQVPQAFLDFMQDMAAAECLFFADAIERALVVAEKEGRPEIAYALVTNMSGMFSNRYAHRTAMLQGGLIGAQMSNPDFIVDQLRAVIADFRAQAERGPEDIENQDPENEETNQAPEPEVQPEIRDEKLDAEKAPDWAKGLF